MTVSVKIAYTFKGIDFCDLLKESDKYMGL